MSPKEWKVVESQCFLGAFCVCGARERGLLPHGMLGHGGAGSRLLGAWCMGRKCKKKTAKGQMDVVVILIALVLHVEV